MRERHVPPPSHARLVGSALVALAAAFVVVIALEPDDPVVRIVPFPEPVLERVVEVVEPPRHERVLELAQRLPEPEPAARPEPEPAAPPELERPAPQTRPRVEPLAPTPAPPRIETRTPRRSETAPARVERKRKSPTLAGLTAPALAPESPPRQPRRSGPPERSPTRTATRAVGIEPVAPQPPREPVPPPARAPVASARSARPARSRPPSGSRRPRAPGLPAAPDPAATAVPEVSTPPRRGRAPVPSRSTASQARPRVAPTPSVASADTRVDDLAARRDDLTARGPRTAAPVLTSERASRDGRDIRGVPLASLAACKRDRDEDALKQRVIARAAGRSACTSDAGHYRLVETRNLNAFLMWIERAPGQRVGDRCDELRRALRCLAPTGERP